jgi:ABC-type branched-subunit amino acid transport system permease subunit
MYVILPAVLAIYAVVMAIIGYPRYRDMNKMNEYYFILIASLAASILLYFILKKRHQFRNRS